VKVQKIKNLKLLQTINPENFSTTMREICQFVTFIQPNLVKCGLGYHATEQRQVHRPNITFIGAMCCPKIDL